MGDTTAKIDVLDAEIANLKSRQLMLTKDNGPVRYTYHRGGLTHEEWYYTVIESQIPERQIAITLELLNEWRVCRRGAYGRMYGVGMSSMSQQKYDATILLIQNISPSLYSIRDLLFPDPSGKIFISAIMKESAIPAIIQGTIRIINTPGFNIPQPGVDEILVDDYQPLTTTYSTATDPHARVRPAVPRGITGP